MHDSAIPSRSMLALFTFVLGFSLPAVAATNARVSESYGKLPLQFEANRGQTHEDVHFLSRGAGYSLYLTAGEAVLLLSKPDADAKRVALRMSLVGAARKPQVNGLDELPGKANYFVGGDRSRWRTNVPTYAKVQYQNIYPGIDLVYYGNQRQLEYDFVVAPGADPNKIVLGFKGANKIEIDTEGSLVLHPSGGDIRQHKPILYQEIDGVRHEVAGSYVRKGANRFGFQVAAYDASRPLVIDPIVVSYSTYLGGSNGEQSYAIAVDAGGNAYVAGATVSLDFPTTPGAFQSTFAGSNPSSGGGDVFVAKLNPAGSALVYSTYLGGSSAEKGFGIAVDADGSAYVTGRTDSLDFPTTPDAFQATFALTGDAFNYNAFVTKLNPTGSELAYSTYLGGSGDDRGIAIALDAAGNAYVAGHTTSTNFPTTPGAFQADCALTGDSGRFFNVFVTKLNPTGSGLVYSTYLGGYFQDVAEGIAVDGNGNAYITGETASANFPPFNFPTTPGAFQTTIGADSFHVFVTKLDPAGSGLVYSTFLGGNGEDLSGGIAIDSGGNAYVTGSTRSTNFQTTAGAFQPVFAGGFYDAYVSKLDPTGSALVYSTYLGGLYNDQGLGIAVDATGNAYVTGSTCCATGFPTTPGAFQPNFGGGLYDAFVAKLNPTGSALVYSTYLGGSNDDVGIGIAATADGNVYVAGSAVSTDFPTTPGAFQPVFAGGGRLGGDSAGDAFVAKFVDNTPPPPTPSGSGTTRSEESAATETGFWTSYGAETGSFSGGSIVASNVAESSAIFSFTGTAVSWIGVKCNVCGIAAVSIDGGAPTTVNTAGPNAWGSLSSESVFSASGLAAGSHTMVIIVTGMSSSGGAYVALDAFDVTGGSGTSPLLPPVVLPPPPLVVPPLPPIPGL